jgi:hypothetical protein
MDGGGLFVLVTNSGSKLWQFNYRFDGKHKTLALGKYPLISLSDARSLHKEACKLLEMKIDPSEDRKDKAYAITLKNKNTLSAVVEEWFEKHQAEVNPGTFERSWDKQGRIPKGRRLSPAITVWGSDVIDAWLHSTQTA